MPDQSKTITTADEKTNAQKVNLSNVVSPQLAPVITHLKNSFEKAEKLLDGGKLVDLQMACAELCISNAEARDMMGKFSG